MKLRNLALALVLSAPFIMQAQDAKKSEKPATAEQKQPKEAQDPVCGMMVETSNAPKSDFKGKTYYFCSIDEKKEFDKAPTTYIKVETKDTTKK